MVLVAKLNSLLSEASQPSRTSRPDNYNRSDRASTAMDPEEDFQSFVAARSAALFRGALVLTGNREAAEDLVQETLERACRRWRTIATKDAPEAYVRRIMVNLANDRWRRFRPCRTPA